MSERISVAAFGSCRVISPVTIAHRRNLLDFLNFDQRWYTHTAAETLQKIAILTGKIEVPSDVAPLLIDLESIQADSAASVLNRQHIPNYFATIDAAVIEISTRRIFDLNGLYLHATAVQKFRNGKEDVPEKALLEKVREFYIDFAALGGEVEQIAALFPRVIFYLTIERGDDLVAGSHPGRRALNDFFRKLADETKIFIFDPNVWVDSFGVKAALEDNNHFTGPYQSYLSARLVDLIKRICPAHNQVAVSREDVSLKS